MLDIGIMAGYTVAMLLFFVYAGGAMAFRDKLVTLRKARGISQEVLADYIGIARQSVAKWEAGESLPDLEKLLAISQYFLVSLDALVRDDPYVYPHAPPALIPDPALLQFLCTAKRATYAGAGTEVTSSRLQSHDLYYAAGPLEYYDTYLGGTHFAGTEALWQHGTPIWAMNYVGRVLDARFSGDFLKEALQQVSEAAPYRGPQLYQRGALSYQCRVEGAFDWFIGSEDILANGDVVYACHFHGGRIA